MLGRGVDEESRRGEKLRRYGRRMRNLEKTSSIPFPTIQHTSDSFRTRNPMPHRARGLIVLPQNFAQLQLDSGAGKRIPQPQMRSSKDIASFMLYEITLTTLHLHPT